VLAPSGDRTLEGLGMLGSGIDLTFLTFHQAPDRAG
jgi:hypothetical protein